MWPLPLRPQLLAISPPAPAPGTQPLTQTHFPSETFVLALPSAREVLPQRPPAPSISSLRPLVKCLLLLEAHPDHLFSHCSLTPFLSFMSLCSTCNHPIYIHISIAVCLPFKSNVSSRGQGFFVFCFFFPSPCLKNFSYRLKQKANIEIKRRLSTFWKPGVVTTCALSARQPGPDQGPRAVFALPGFCEHWLLARRTCTWSVRTSLE